MMSHSHKTKLNQALLALLADYAFLLLHLTKTLILIEVATTVLYGIFLMLSIGQRNFCPRKPTYDNFTNHARHRQAYC